MSVNYVVSFVSLWITHFTMMVSGCVFLHLLLHLFLKQRKKHISPLLSIFFFILWRNLGHMPLRNAKCFNLFPPFLSGCHLQGLFLCPEVICSGWTIKAIIVEARFPIMRGDDWQQRDGWGWRALGSNLLDLKARSSLAALQIVIHKQNACCKTSPLFNYNISHCQCLIRRGLGDWSAI